MKKRRKLFENWQVRGRQEFSGNNHYDAGSGRWLDKDPIRFDGGLNFYVYAGNDPVNYIDIDGLKPGVLFNSQDEAAIEAIKEIIDESIKKNKEKGGMIYKNKDGKYDPNGGWIDFLGPCNLKQGKNYGNQICSYIFINFFS